MVFYVYLSSNMYEYKVVIIVNSSFSWSAHIDSICLQAYRMLHVIRRNTCDSEKENVFGTS